MAETNINTKFMSEMYFVEKETEKKKTVKRSFPNKI